MVTSLIFHLPLGCHPREWKGMDVGWCLVRSAYVSGKGLYLVEERRSCWYWFRMTHHLHLHMNRPTSLPRGRRVISFFPMEDLLVLLRGVLEKKRVHCGSLEIRLLLLIAVVWEESFDEQSTCFRVHSPTFLARSTLSALGPEAYLTRFPVLLSARCT